MELTGEYRISAPRETVWKAILDPEVLKRCIPGCKELEQTGDNAYAAKVQVKVGPVSATFSGSVELTDMEAPPAAASWGRATAASPASPRARPRCLWRRMAPIPSSPMSLMRRSGVSSPPRRAPCAGDREEAVRPVLHQLR